MAARWIRGAGSKIAMAALVLILFSSIQPFFQHWSNAKEEWSTAQSVLSSDLCTAAQTLSRAGGYASVCQDARNFMSLYPVVRAFIETIREWYICRGNGCAVLLSSVYDHIWSFALLMGGVWAIGVYLFGAHRGQVYMNTVPLPMNNYCNNHRPSIEYYNE